MVLTETSYLLYPALFLVAMLYSSVGHGGASGYLAILSLFHTSQFQMAASSLCLNLLVAAAASFMFWRSNYFRWNLFWPFAITSIPFAWIGGLLSLSSKTYFLLLAVTLLFAAFRIGITLREPSKERRFNFSIPAAMILGALIGILSGLVGVGGGIFLSPLLLLVWRVDAKEVAAVSAPFIWVNSAAGVYGHLNRSGLDVLSLWPFAVVAFVGGCIGSYVGAMKFKNLVLRKVLALVLMIAAYKAFLQAL